MRKSFWTTTISAVLALGMVGSIAVEPVLAQGRNDRDRYVERYYREHGRDRDYDDWRRGRWSDDDYRRWYRHRHRHDNDDAVGAATLFGLAAGALAGGIIANQQRDYPVETGSVRRVPSAGGYAPGTDGYYAYCSAKYRSFDPRSFTFLGRDGERHYCR